MSSRPNFLLITTDQQRWDALSCLDAAGYRTPNLDRLAGTGVHFRNAYCPSPVCTPARVSMITGQYPTRHGATQIGVRPVAALDGETLPRVLGRAGYATACIGKTHFVARKYEAAHVAGRPIDEAVPEDFWDTFDGSYCGFDFVRHHGVHTCASVPDGHYRAWLRRQGANLAAIDALHLPLLPKAPGCPMPLGRWMLEERWHPTRWITEEGREWIARQSGPWLCMLNYQDPHAPFVCPEPWFSAVDMTGVPLPEMVPAVVEGKPPFYRSLIERDVYEDEAGESLADGIRLAGFFRYRFGEHTADAIRAYIGMVNLLDAWIGRLVDWLEARGQLENTVIVFTSDHGEQLGRHGLWEKGVCAYDDCQRIPAIVHWPAGAAVNRGPVDGFFNLVDIVPTFASLAGAPLPVGVQGFDHGPFLRGDEAATRDWALVDFLASSKLHQQTFVTERHKLVIYRGRSWGELYDRIADPEQRRNLFDDPDHRGVRDALLGRLLDANLTVAGKPAERVAYA